MRDQPRFTAYLWRSGRILRFLQTNSQIIFFQFCIRSKKEYVASAFVAVSGKFFFLFRMVIK